MATDVNIRASGRNAYFAGKTTAHNPFAAGSPARMFWHQGFKAGRKEAARDPLAFALRTDNLDVAIKIIRTALRVTDPKTAEKNLAGAENRRRFANLPNAAQKAEFIRSWFLAELYAASERILQNG